MLYYYAHQYELVQRVYRARLSAEAASGGGAAIEGVEAESLAGVPAARLPAALSLLRRHREVDRESGDEVRHRGGRATATLQEMGAQGVVARGDGDAASPPAKQHRADDGGDDAKTGSL
jgi:hypothetical protein